MAAAAPHKPAAVQREDWMTVPMARSAAAAGIPQDTRRGAKQQQKEEPDAEDDAPVVGGIRYMKPEQAAAAGLYVLFVCVSVHIDELHLPPHTHTTTIK